MNKSEHWAWYRPLSEFYPLGDKKLMFLISYVKTIKWFDDKGKKVNPLKMAKDFISDRHLASQVYVVYKKEVDEYIEQCEKENLEREKCEEKNKDKKDIKLENNVINFSDFKKAKAG